tara:strand:+ start:3498 stop:5225 length:1728 start_codon:yes stop_codon:yes gene_type:complete
MKIFQVNLNSIINKFSTIIFILGAFFVMEAQVNLSTNFVDSSHRKQPVYNVWQVANDISPKYEGDDDGPQIRPDLKMNIIRLSGGIKVANNTKQENYDMVHWSEVANDYVYDFSRLMHVIDKADEHRDQIYQLVVDNVPWCFQRCYTFVDLDKNSYDGVHFRKFEEVEQYGNALPPCNLDEYGAYVMAFMQTLVDNYGMERVKTWRFRVGSEIESPGHWKGTAEDFVAYFDVSMRAIREIVPDAHVGIHTREPHYVAVSAKGLNYKGEQFLSFHNEIIEHCYTNNLHINSWGLSYYIQFDKAGEFSTNGKWYDERVAPLVNHPKWNHETEINIEEFKATSSFRSPDGRFATLKAVSTHGEVAHIAMSNLFYKHPKMNQIHRWLQYKDVEDDVANKELLAMVGKTRYESIVNGTPNNPSDLIDAIFVLDDKTNTYEALIYNYNDQSTDYGSNQSAKISFIVDFPVGSKVKYRNAYYSKPHNKLQCFKSEPYFKESFYIDGTNEGQKFGEASRILKPEIYDNKYVKYNGHKKYAFGDWKYITTKPRSDGAKKGSEITIDTNLDSFSFRKFEFRITEI